MSQLLITKYEIIYRSFRAKTEFIQIKKAGNIYPMVLNKVPADYIVGFYLVFHCLFGVEFFKKANLPDIITFMLR